MSVTGNIPITQGNGGNYIATYNITEDGISKSLQRIVNSDSNGVEIDPWGKPSATVLQKTISINASGDTFIISSSGTTTINIYKITFLANTAGTVQLFSGASSSGSNLFGTLVVNQGGGFSYDGDNFPIICKPGDGFNISTTGTQSIAGRVWYTQANE